MAAALEEQATPRGRLMTAEAVMAFALSADRGTNPRGAKLTLVSSSGKQFTYGVRAGDKDGFWFVDGLVGPDNDSDYRYLGDVSARRPSVYFDVYSGRQFKAPSHGFRRARAAGHSTYALTPNPQAETWAWFWTRIVHGHLPDNVEVWHEGRCGRCGRTLTVPSSIETGIGPVCARKMAS